MTSKITLLPADPAAERPMDAALMVPDAAEQRHSIRKYLPGPIPEHDLREIVRLVGLAPSAFNLQPWRLVVVREPELKARLHEAAFRQNQVAEAPAVFALYTDMADTLESLDEVIHPGLSEEQREATKDRLLGQFGAQSEAEREAWAAKQGHIALGYLVLVAQSLGYATSVMGGFEPEKVKQVLGLPQSVTLPALVAIGVANEAGFPTHRHPVDRIATFR